MPTASQRWLQQNRLPLPPEPATTADSLRLLQAGQLALVGVPPTLSATSAAVLASALAWLRTAGFSRVANASTLSVPTSDLSLLPQLDRSGFYQRVEAAVAHLPPHRIGDAFKRLLAPPPTESNPAEVERLEWLLEWVEIQRAPLIDLFSATHFAALLSDIEDHRHALVHQQRLDANDLTEAQAAAHAYVTRRLARAMSEAWPGQRAIVVAPWLDIAHNRDDVAISDSSPCTNYLGEFAREVIAPEQTVTIWLMPHQNPRSKRSNKITLDSLLGPSSGPSLLPMHTIDDAPAAWRGRVHIKADSLTFSCTLHRQIDLLAICAG